ncbi:PREDICTED: lck-interacting transmembrane adapter 1 isoform X5 [Chinchilla lanigera]|uniref:lck-interacting transmembrane adapter 1 isoform X5 n=1 Tax=Chinchilla lanigera TaxID=34839 RepID=UPI00038EC750|nr:PREDICTED: lck-interacting transmembrane adapter 1 isoform X5 [Chinchilla lanigera]
MVPSWRSEMGPWTAEFVRQVWGWQFSASAWWLLIIHWTCCVPCRPCLPIYYGEDSPASQDGATSACVPASPLGPRVFLPAPLAVGVVHSLPQEAGAEPPGKTTGHCDAGRSAHPTPGYTSCTTVPVSAKVDVLYSRVCKPKIKDLGPTADHPDCMGTEAILALERDLAYEPLPLRRLGMDSSPLENVYESIREVGARASPEPPSLPLSIRGHSRPPRPLGKVWRPLS